MRGYFLWVPVSVLPMVVRHKPLRFGLLSVRPRRDQSNRVIEVPVDIRQYFVPVFSENCRAGGDRVEMADVEASAFSAALARNQRREIGKFFRLAE